jgi:cytochrome P450
VAGDSSRHDALRVVLRPLLGGRAAAALEPVIAEICHGLLDELGGAPVVDLAGGYARRVPVLVTCALLGVPSSDERRLAAWVDRVFGRRPGSVEVPPATTEAYRELCAYLGERSRDGATHGLAELRRACDAGSIEPSEVIDVAFIVVAAGIKTTSTLIGSMLLALARDPVQAALVWKDSSRSAAVVEEALRFDSPAQWVTRITTRDAVTPYGVIPEGERVLFLLGSANRDERRYARADRFDVTRRRRRHLAFGSGLHFCSGATLARLEARIALEVLCSRAESVELAGEPTRIFTPAERELGELPLLTTIRPR